MNDLSMKLDAALAMVDAASDDYYTKWRNLHDKAMRTKSGAKAAEYSTESEKYKKLYQEAKRAENASKPKLDAALAMADASAQLSSVKKELSSLGMTIKDNRDFGEFIVNFYNGGSEASAYYTNDLNDALLTGRDMARRRSGGKDKEKADAINQEKIEYAKIWSDKGQWWFASDKTKKKNGPFNTALEARESAKASGYRTYS